MMKPTRNVSIETESRDADDDLVLAEEIEQFSKDREKIDLFLKAVNRTKLGPMGRIVDVAFIVALFTLFFARFVFNWINDVLSLEFGVLLVSLKIIWLMKIQSNYNHFMFMLMHASEFKQNLTLQRLDEIESKLTGPKKTIEKEKKKPQA